MGTIEPSKVLDMKVGDRRRETVFGPEATDTQGPYGSQHAGPPGYSWGQWDSVSIQIEGLELKSLVWGPRFRNIEIKDQRGK